MAFEETKLTQPTILITGGASGIGAAIASRLAQSGAQIIIADREPATIPNTRSIICDISDEAQINSLITGISTVEGTLSGLVCNAGLMIRKPVSELTLEEWNSVLATNLTSTFLLARAGAAMLRASKGSILTIASTRAHMSEHNTESYSASKGGLLALSHALAISLGPDIRVNTISPGWINSRGEPLTPQDHAQHPAGRVGSVGDIASLAAYLLSAEAGFITGSEFIIDGGMTRKMIYEE